jgi:tetratricopeptide (TPR) repeat protein
VKALAKKHLAIVFCLATTCASAQVTTGTRAPEDTSSEDAANARITTAESALEKGDFQAASDELTKLAAELPNDARVLYDLGFAAEHLDNATAAADAYTKATAADPMLAEPQIALGLLDAREGRTDKARSELQTASNIATASPDLRGRALRALTQIDLKTDPAAASDDLLKAIQFTGEQPGDAELSAQLAERAGDAPGAEGAYRKALATAPGDIDAAVGLARALKTEGKLAEAQSTLTAAIDASPANAEDSRLVAELAAVYSAEGKDAQAIPLVEQLRTKNPDAAKSPAITEMLARLYAMNARDADAEPLYKSLVTASPDDPTLLDALGGVLVKEAKNDEAVAVLKKAVSMRAAFHDDQAWGEAASHLAFAASRGHQPELCLQALAARATVLPNSPASLFLEATAHDSLHQKKEAIASYKAFLAAANGKFPDEEFESRHRLIALEHER